MDIKFQINNNSQAVAIIESDRYIPLQVQIEYSIPISPGKIYLYYRNSHNLIEFKFGNTLGEFYGITIILSDRLLYTKQHFNESRYITFQMPSYFLFPTTVKSDEPILSIDIENPCTIELFLNEILIRLPDKREGRLIFYQNNNFGVIADEELNVTGFLIKNLSHENQKAMIELVNKYTNKRT